jgi:ABC-type multidrug transport system fused ATPase/permease subunit
MAVVVEALFKAHALSGSLRASERLYRGMTFSVLRMPLLWMDSTSMGEMLKRFTVDNLLVDNDLLETLTESAGSFVKLALIIFVG